MAETIDAGKPNIVLGVAVGILLALVSSILWYLVVVITKFQLGIIAVVVGVIVGYGMLVGAGNKSSRQLQMMGVLLTILSMALSEYLIAYHFINQELEAEGMYLPLLVPVSVIIEIIAESLKEDMLTLVFWAIAIYEAYKILMPKEIMGQRASA